MPDAEVVECVINLAEGRDHATLDRIADEAGSVLLDQHRDGDHHRSVLTLAGPGDEVAEAALRVARRAVAALDLRAHRGAHPRLGTLDVVPWVHLAHADGGLVDGDLRRAVTLRDRFAGWASSELSLPCFLYGPNGPSLPELRRSAWRSRLPDTGPARPHPTAGAVCVGARPLLVAYNLWLARADLDLARRVARDLRGPYLRTLGLLVGSRVQVSCNLVAPTQLGPAEVWDAVARRAEIAAAELVGLIPGQVLSRIARHRWAELDLSPERTIEARLEEAGLDGGRPPR
jgi:glutamate formiminotransferase